MPSRLLLWTAFTASFLLLMAVTVFAQATLLNVSCELYKDVNPAASYAIGRTKPERPCRDLDRSLGGDPQDAF